MPCPNTHAPTLEMEPADPAAATPFSRHALPRSDGTLALDTDGVSRSVMAHGTFIAWTALQMIMDAVESSALLLCTRLPRVSGLTDASIGSASADRDETRPSCHNSPDRRNTDKRRWGGGGDALLGKRNADWAEARRPVKFGALTRFKAALQTPREFRLARSVHPEQQPPVAPIDTVQPEPDATNFSRFFFSPFCSPRSHSPPRLEGGLEEKQDGSTSVWLCSVPIFFGWLIARAFSSSQALRRVGQSSILSPQSSILAGPWSSSSRHHHRILRIRTSSSSPLPPPLVVALLINMAAARSAFASLARVNANRSTLRSLSTTAAAKQPSALLEKAKPIASSSRLTTDPAALTAFIPSSSRNASTDAKPQEMTVRDALNSAMEEEMLRDDKVFILGEEVARYNGAYKVTRGLLDKFGEKRVIDTPHHRVWFRRSRRRRRALRPAPHLRIHDVQLCHAGHRPGHQLGRKDLLHVRRQRAVPDRLPRSQRCRRRCGCAALAGLRRMEALSDDFTIPIGKAKIERAGKDVTIVSHSIGMNYAMEAAEILKKEEGVEAEVINLRTIAPMDVDTILESVRKTNRIVTVESGFPLFSVGAEIAATVNDFAFDHLDAPVERVSGAAVPTPYAQNLEKLAFPDTAVVVRAAKRALYK
ncbi:hypothetical protein L1887_60841 [Cichorium endivia]|nr:hypothetical protein L1887_60841 [Cichorium endivia]